MAGFNALQDVINIQELIKTTFDVDLSLSGGWGYNQKKSTIIESLPQNMTLLQLEHMISTIRANLEMNITQEKDARYTGINTSEKLREIIHDDKRTFHKIIYEITAIKEDLYHAFIKEYKAGYENKTLDLNEHFKKRKEATLIREVAHYFEVSHIRQEKTSRVIT